MILDTIYVIINNINPTALEETKMYNIYSIFRDLFILTLIVFLLSFVLLCIDKKRLRTKKIYKFIDKCQTTAACILIICLFIFAISLIGFVVSDRMIFYSIKNAMVDYFNADVKLHNDEQLIVNGDEYYEYKYDDKKDEIILDKINSDEKIVIKDVFGK